MLLVLPVSLIEAPFAELFTVTTSPVVLFLISFLIVGLGEEGAKSLLLYKLHINDIEVNEAVDPLIYGIAIGLGFATAENLFYTIIYGYQTGIYRAVITTLAHASFTGFFGYYFAKYLFQNKNKIYLIKGLI